MNETIMKNNGNYDDIPAITEKYLNFYFSVNITMNKVMIPWQIQTMKSLNTCIPFIYFKGKNMYFLKI